MLAALALDVAVFNVGYRVNPVAEWGGVCVAERSAAVTQHGSTVTLFLEESLSCVILR